MKKKNMTAWRRRKKRKKKEIRQNGTKRDKTGQTGQHDTNSSYAADLIEEWVAGACRVQILFEPRLFRQYSLLGLRNARKPKRNELKKPNGSGKYA